ncbi:MAG: hypothetical protein MUE32_06310 [Bacteroidales bacterium]|jgi:hypothetical protein|nr:hypothetical protein [Bacteroidales bacterium]
MDTIEIFLMVFVFSFVAFRLYQKYGRKNGPVQQKMDKSSTSIPQGQKGEEYEPYSGNKTQRS